VSCTIAVTAGSSVTVGVGAGGTTVQSGVGFSTGGCAGYSGFSSSTSSSYPNGGQGTNYGFDNTYYMPGGGGGRTYVSVGGTVMAVAGAGGGGGVKVNGPTGGQGAPGGYFMYGTSQDRWNFGNEVSLGASGSNSACPTGTGGGSPTAGGAGGGDGYVGGCSSNIYNPTNAIGIDGGGGGSSYVGGCLSSRPITTMFGILTPNNKDPGGCGSLNTAGVGCPNDQGQLLGYSQAVGYGGYGVGYNNGPVNPALWMANGANGYAILTPSAT